MRDTHTTMMEVVATHSAARVLDVWVSKRADVTTTIHTGRGYQGVSLNQNGGAVLRFNCGTEPRAGEEQTHQVVMETLSSKGGGEKVQ